MYTLYGSRGSGSAAVEAALTLAGLPFQQVRASTWEPDSARDALAKVNPLGQIPTLVMPDGSVMTESAAILVHLGLAAPQAGLLPQEPMARAQCIRGLAYIAANCYSAISVIDYPERWTTATDTPALEQVRQGTRARLHAHWDIFADTFGGKPFLSGAQAGALDILAAVVSRWSGARRHLAASRPALAAVLLAVDTHPALLGVFAQHWDWQGVPPA